MRRKPIGIPVIAAVLLACAASPVLGQDDESTSAAKTLDIQGTYILVSRDLPDGTSQKPPDVVGMMTLTGKYRNFNVAWSDSAGKRMSISYIAEYQLTDTVYSEKSLYFFMNDEITGSGVKYDFSQPTGKAAVKREGGKIVIKLPLYDEPEVVFEKDKLTASRPGAFVDHWEKVR